MSNEMELLKRDYYLNEKNDIAVKEIDQCIIINEKFLKYVARPTEFSSDSDSSVEEQHEWYPYVNSYYPYTEDVDALERVNHLLGSDYSPSSYGSSATEMFFEKKFPISEREVQNQYLLASPLSFIIVGKPEIGQKDLGKMLADYWRSVYIEPETLIREEVMNGSKTGQCIEFNLRHGRAIGIDVILKLVEKRIKSESAIHRGVVVCGLPVVANDLYVEDPVSTMSALFNAKEIFKETLDTVLQKAQGPGPVGSPALSRIRTEDDESERETDEYTETETGFPDYSTLKSTLFRHISDLPADIGGDDDINFFAEIGNNYEEQLKYLFDLIREPFLIIHMMCCTQDVIEKRNSCKFSVYSKCETQVTKTQTHDKEESGLYDVLNYVDKRHLVRVPRNFPANICTQLDNYHTTAVKFLEQKILLHDPQYFLKVDARNEIEVIFETVRMKLTTLPHYRVACPDLLSRLDIKIDSGEDKSELDMIGKIDYDQFFKLYRTHNAPGSFKWTWSDWKTMCPVSMKEGHCKNGDVDYAMHFMNRIFFLADEGALIKFYRNPRRYLLPPFPKPLCKIYIFGPHGSGKSTVAKCLAYYLDGTIMYPTDMFKQILEEEVDQVKDRIRQAAINEATSMLMLKRREEAASLEEERLKKIKEWVAFTISEIQRLIQLLEEHQREEVVTKFEISSFPMAMEKKSMADLETETTLAIRQIRDYLEQEKIPFSKDIKFLENLISDKRKILQHLPENLRRRIKPLPVRPDDPFVQDFAAEAVANAAVGDLDISSENIVNMLVNAMKESESEYARKGHNKGGWILDNMLCDTSLLEELYPEYMADDIILLKDASPNFEYSVNRYTNWKLENFKEFQQLFLNLNKTDVSCPSQYVSSGDSSKIRIVQNIFSEILDKDLIYLKDELESKRPDNYRRDLEHFYEKWESIKEFFNKKNRDVMEIDIANKNFPELLEEIIRKIDRKYCLGAQRYTEEDRTSEVTDLTNERKQPTEITEGTLISAAVSEENRIFGNTFHFCPVTFHEKWVLWKGKDEFAAKFENKVYLLCSDGDLQRFLNAPKDFFSRDSHKSLPPPRICVIGDPVSRKTKISQAISSNYGLSYVSFLELVKKEYNIPSYESFFEMSQNSKIYSFIFNYLHVGEPLPETLYAKLSKLWFTPPIKEFGFVLDDFPKRDCDVAMMVKYKLIPDIVILLSGNKNLLKAKLLETVLQNWKLRKAKGYSDINHVAILELEEKRQKRFQELLDERRERRFTQKQKGKESKDKSALESAETDPESNQSGTGTTSQISFNSVEEQKDIDDINKILDVELPEVVSEQTEETFEEAKGRLEIQVSETFAHETQCIESLKNEFKAHNIPLENVVVEIDFHERTVRKVFYIIDPIKNRNQSFFEKCYDVDIGLAEKLLSDGYFFLSKFGRLCPVHYHNNNNPFYLYEVALKNNSVFPVIHRSFIYFIYSEENLEKFKYDPLLYVNIENVEFPLIPFMLAITGPPKCGKTELANRLRKEFGLKVITRGQAIRDVLLQFPYCSLAIQMENILRKGWELPDELVIKCVEAVCCDGHAVVQGVVFDGFPNNISEVRHLSYVGLVPSLVIDLEATTDEVFNCLQSCSGKGNMPRFSHLFFEHILNEWTETSEVFKTWFDGEYQVSVKIPITPSMWSVFRSTKQYAFSVFFEIKHYFNKISKDWPLRIANMRVTPLEFLERQSSFKSFCPCCIEFSDELVSGGQPPDRTGLVQYRKYFYWLCPNHIELFLNYPDKYLPPYCSQDVPRDLPTKITDLKRFPDNVAEGGICVVCYKNSRVLKKGNCSHAVKYANKIFGFDTETCIESFMRKPREYQFIIGFKHLDEYPSLNYKNLPILGMLEQYVAIPIIKALQFVSGRRPLIPGLSISTSAVISVGLYIKIYYAKIPQEYKDRYMEGAQLFHKRRKSLITFLDIMKNTINPYLYYEEPMPEFKLPE